MMFARNLRLLTCACAWLGYNFKSVTSEPCPEDKALRCENDGVCQTGMADFGFHESLDIPFLDTNHVDMMHCACKHGYTGVYCQHEVAICGDNEHACFFGSECNPDDMFPLEFMCDCSKIFDPMNSYAGSMCEHASTSMCEHAAIKSHSFCTNGGTCKEIITAGREHMGCECGEEYTGNRCEIKVNKKSENNISKNIGSGTDSSNDTTDGEETEDSDSEDSDSEDSDSDKSSEDLEDESLAMANFSDSDSVTSSIHYLFLGAVVVATLAISLVLLSKVLITRRASESAKTSIDVPPNDLELRTESSSVSSAHPSPSAPIEKTELKDVEII